MFQSEAESTEIAEEFEDKPADHSTRSRSSVSEDIKTASPSASQSASVAEDLPGYQSPLASRSESRPSGGARDESRSAERKRTLSEGDSDEGSARDGTPSAAKGTPTASDSTVMQKLKKLKNQSGEKWVKATRNTWPQNLAKLGVGAHLICGWGRVGTKEKVGIVAFIDQKTGFWTRFLGRESRVASRGRVPIQAHS